MHPTVIFGVASQESTAAASRAFKEIVDLSLDLGGTISGERGVGLPKREHLGKELGERSSTIQWELRQLFDPDGVLDPGEALP